MKDPRSIIAIVFATALTLGIGWFAWQTEKAGHDKAIDPSKQLAAAIRSNKPARAPEGTADYVKGVRRYFGRVRSARYLDAHTDRHGEGASATTEVVTEILLRTKRGAAVLELEFDDEEITGVEEEEPEDVRSDVDDRVMAALKRGFAARGADSATSLDLDGSFPGGPAPRGRSPKAAAVPPPPEDPAALERDRRKRQKHLKCIQDARGDVDKMVKCP